eukprot:CAMPEP_0197662998 /NCGR_PEP_ID=MMETSP1338-20131121/55713_1 /TAXON_ID=43686 ORGANISM="Pelagodinium beii, Strain RCC1491" /NCGR_SAMPLE_ID=MMETSP1338 /ASSEMBLY_ACC=CAM_ASM_000754 /LENGTH=248 /DNA_ID=CAMNT_0043241151 /DNA_START=55 /DNA_END=798 /DNA_ORIENTATION=+
MTAMQPSQAWNIALEERPSSSLPKVESTSSCSGLVRTESFQVAKTGGFVGFDSTQAEQRGRGSLSASSDASSSSSARGSLEHAWPIDLPLPPTFVPASFGVYDEQLQDDVFLGRRDMTTEMEVKNTFIHIPVESSFTDERESKGLWQSAPSILVMKSWRTKFPAMEEAHIRGECRPCAYFLYKKDGCRHGDDCQYCHLCTRGEIKRRKKKKVKALKAADAAAGEIKDDQQSTEDPEVGVCGTDDESGW